MSFPFVVDVALEAPGGGGAPRAAAAVAREPPSSGIVLGALAPPRAWLAEVPVGINASYFDDEFGIEEDAFPRAAAYGDDEDPPFAVRSGFAGLSMSMSNAWS